MGPLSVVVPVYHNADTLMALHTRLSRVFDALPELLAELIFVDDGSSDGSYEVLHMMATVDPRVRLVKLSRNFGSTAAILAGLAYVTGEWVVVIAADLQDPPELILDLVQTQVATGREVILGVRKSREDPWSTRLFASTFYLLFRRFALATMPPMGFDCFLLSRRVYGLLLDTATPNTYLMGQILWLGFPHEVVPYHRKARPAGRSMWSFWRKVRYFVDSFVSFSYAPVRASSVLGILLALVGFIYALVVVIYRLVWAVPVEGWSSLMIVILLLCGAQLTVLGVLGEYVWRTLDVSRKRPIFVVESTYTAWRPSAPAVAEAEPVREPSDRPT
jgi:polyisoprenyl-phosphate glycosyltransferase